MTETTPTPTALSGLTERLTEIEQRHRAAQGWAESAGHVGFGERTGATDYPERWKLDTAIDAHKDRAFLLSSLKSSAEKEAGNVQAAQERNAQYERDADEHERVVAFLEAKLREAEATIAAMVEALTNIRDYNLSRDQLQAHAAAALASPSEAAAALWTLGSPSKR